MKKYYLVVENDTVTDLYFVGDENNTKEQLFENAAEEAKNHLFIGEDIVIVSMEDETDVEHGEFARAAWVDNSNAEYIPEAVGCGYYSPWVLSEQQ